MVIDSLERTFARAGKLLEPDQASEARFILSAMETAGSAVEERRRASRFRFCVEATLRLGIDGPGDAPRRIYTRDLSPLGLGFISPVLLPLGCCGTLRLPAPGEGLYTIACKVVRCREMTKGWFDAAVAFKDGISRQHQKAT